GLRAGPERAGDRGRGHGEGAAAAGRAGRGRDHEPGLVSGRAQDRVLGDVRRDFGPVRGGRGGRERAGADPGPGGAAPTGVVAGRADAGVRDGRCSGHGPAVAGLRAHGPRTAGRGDRGGPAAAAVRGGEAHEPAVLAGRPVAVLRGGPGRDAGRVPAGSANGRGAPGHPARHGGERDLGDVHAALGGVAERAARVRGLRGTGLRHLCAGARGRAGDAGRARGGGGLGAVGGMLPPVEPSEESLVDSYLADAATGLQPAEEFTDSRYRPSLRLDYIGPPTVGVAVDRSSTMLSGSAAFYFGDLLGNRQLAVGVQAQGTLKDVGGQVIYTNRAHRWNWLVGAGRVPYLTGATYIRDTTVVVGGAPTRGRVVGTYRDRIYLDQALVTA